MVDHSNRERSVLRCILVFNYDKYDSRMSESDRKRKDTKGYYKMNCIVAVR